MKLNIIYLIVIILLLSCTQSKQRSSSTNNQTDKNCRNEPLSLTLEQANILAELPLACIQIEYPNKLGQVIGDKNDLKEPHELHPAFFGCFDWHSAVHRHWSLVKLLKEFPQLEKANLIKNLLLETISQKNIEAEVAYFRGVHNYSFERTYGWGWLLKLSEELNTWDDPIAKELEQNLKPLTDLIVQNYIDFLPKLRYPIRVGEHTNTAFGLTFAWDYAATVGNEELKSLIESKALDFYYNDFNCPLSWEPSGYDFLSPCFEEIDLMRRVLQKDDFQNWINKFSPQLIEASFQIKVGEINDRTDGKLVHLDGLNFSRAWVMYGLAKRYPEYCHLIHLANKHVEYSLPNLVGDSYEGSHWLGTFAIYALTN